MSSVEGHYTHGRLVRAIAEGLTALGRTPPAVTIDDLGPVDEFHVGGRQATEELMGQLNLSSTYHVLDVGSGLGGPARFVASRYGCRVTGIDLTAEYVEAARTLTEWTGLGDRLTFRQGSALALPFGSASFDAAYIVHVGMNIPDKHGLVAEVARVLKPGALFGIYDVMKTGSAELMFPVPWAATPEIDAIARRSLRDRAPGERIRDRGSAQPTGVRARVLPHPARAHGPGGGSPAAGLHVLMGPDAATKAANMAANIEAGTIAPVEIIARRA